MKRNNLHITWGGENAVMTVTPNGLKESFKCNRLKAAQTVVGRRNKDNIKAAVFTDKDGKKTTII
jgi:hypothetical protein